MTSPHERLAAAGVVHRFTHERLEVRVLQPGQSAPWWPAVAYRGRLIPLPRELAAMPELAAAVAAWTGHGGDMASTQLVAPAGAPGASQRLDRRKAWKLRNRDKVLARKRLDGATARAKARARKLEAA